MWCWYLSRIHCDDNAISFYSFVGSHDELKNIDYKIAEIKINVLVQVPQCPLMRHPLVNGEQPDVSVAAHLVMHTLASQTLLVPHSISADL